MQYIRRKLSRGHPERTILPLLNLRQPTAAMSKAARAVDKSDNVGDSKLQSMLKALAPQEPGEVDLSADQLKEAERR